MSKVYDAEVVDGFLKEASEAMHGVMNVAKGVAEENVRLRQELAIAKEAATNKVTLEKVAAPVAAPLDAGRTGMFVDTLIAHGVVKNVDRAEFIDKCAADGNVVLDVAIAALRSSEVPAQQGHGIKAANAGNSATDNPGLTQEESDNIWRKAFNRCKW